MIECRNPFSKFMAIGKRSENRNSFADKALVGDEEAPRSIIFFGGPVLTIREGQPEVEALAIMDGKIIALGDRKTVFKYHTARTHMVDLEGSAIMPGFIDPHVHLAWSAFTKYRWIDISLPGIRSKRQLIENLRAASEERNAGEWIVAYGYDPSRYPSDEPQLTAMDLDQVADHNPVFVAGISWDVAYVNKRAFEVVGLSANRRRLSDLAYSRDHKGNLTGEVRGLESIEPFLKSLPETTYDQALDDCRSTVRSWAHRGCTTVYDVALGGLLGQTEIRLLLDLASDPTTPMRFRAALVDSNDLPHAVGIKPGQGNHRLRFLGIKFWADSAAPWANGVARKLLSSEIEKGVLNYDDDELHAKMRGWHNEGWQLLVHAMGGSATKQALRVIESILAESPRFNHRHRIDHCAVIEDEQLTKAKQLGVSVSHSIGQMCVGQPQEDPFLKILAQSTAPIAAGLKHGLVVSLHSDAPTTQVDPLCCLQTTVSEIARTSGDVFAPDQRIAIDEALKTITLHPAHQCFIDDVAGSLEVGKQADLVILDRNPRAVDPNDIAKIDVLETYIGGVKQSW